MTDEELERLSNAVIRLDGGTYGHAGATKLGRGVLALLERVRKAEDQLARIGATLEYEGPTDGVADAVKRHHDTTMEVCAKTIVLQKAAEAALLCDHGAEREYCTASYNAAVDAARRAGAEEMREKAAKRLEAIAEQRPMQTSWDAGRMIGANFTEAAAVVRATGRTGGKS